MVSLALGILFLKIVNRKSWNMYKHVNEVPPLKTIKNKQNNIKRIIAAHPGTRIYLPAAFFTLNL